MAGVDRVFGNVVDDNGLAVLADLVADRGLDFQLAAGLQAEGDVVANAARNPAVFRDTRNGCEPDARAKTKARKALNPRTGELVKVKGGKTVRFKASSNLKKAV